jgi:tetratricopeptide (TPR) repeat protein
VLARYRDDRLALNPNWASAWLFSGWGKVWLGEPEVAIEHVARALRLSPQDPQIFNAQAAMACAHFFAGCYAETSSWAEVAVREQPNHFIATCVAAASNALTARLPEAQKAMASLRQLDASPLIGALSERRIPVVVTTGGSIDRELLTQSVAVLRKPYREADLIKVLACMVR